MFGILNSIVDLGVNTVKLVVAPVGVALDVANAAVKPLSEVAQDLAKDIKDAVK